MEKHKPLIDAAVNLVAEIVKYTETTVDDAFIPGLRAFIAALIQDAQQLKFKSVVDQEKHLNELAAKCWFTAPSGLALDPMKIFQILQLILELFRKN